jgi:hypothetical protein
MPSRVARKTGLTPEDLRAELGAPTDRGSAAET